MRNKRDKEQQELNEAPVTLAVFLEAYNKGLPAGFSRATVRTLRKFQEAHPTFFKGKDMWSIDRHRKRLFDWLSSNTE
ncbi:MAG: hypothetical protein A2831_03660 [Candidatus Yanofskybacteria bacterium RIFCSPHIGHO2_01_FULL_44_17]|uniref:Uncharacterized protein n=1 Tax=Candidatus Yanofskybacteria bacterium RIFCSPHIGHO2_01_FULL_44_17 TaxID=1802668 RepID=A0A1F8EXY9_9BACT|nr:MAG: hypothetical protein A2831_03660 [Candidatus Yanofskybacteria bacterium RIFCSPHIGHO2_01_FULL_44_17]